MTKELHAALILEAQKFGVLGDGEDVVRLFPNVTDNLKHDDTEAIAKAVATMVAQKPQFFNVPRPWAELDPNSDEWRAREASFRESIRRSRPISSDPTFRELDAARCDEQELGALSRAVGGRANSWDRSILARALARQRQEDAALGGDAA